MMRSPFAALFFCFWSCSSGTDSGTALTPWSAIGPHRAGTTVLSVAVEGRDEPLSARLWYPSSGAPTALPLASLVDDPDHAATLQGLLDEAPAGCPTEALDATEEGPGVSGLSPVVVVSHCHDCLGLSGASVAAALAQHGYLVVAPDHAGNTLFDLLEGNGGSLDESTLAQRARDGSAALSAVLSGEGLPEGLQADPARVGALGHSFGAVTVGRLLRDDPRVQAGFTLGAPLDNPLLSGVDAAAVTVPVLQVLLEEDHSIGTLGNDLMRGNHETLAGEAWLVSMPDGGHWSVSDLCGIVDAFAPGCGDDTRMQGGEAFSYVPADAARQTAGTLAAAFFDHTLRGQDSAAAWLEAPQTPVAVTVETR